MMSPPDANPSAARTRTVIARGADGNPRTYRLAPASPHHVAYRRLALAIVGLDLASLAGHLRITRQSALPRVA